MHCGEPSAGRLALCARLGTEAAAQNVCAFATWRTFPPAYGKATGGCAMKRSELNAILREGKQFLERMNFHLPVWAHWSPEDWANGRATSMTRSATTCSAGTSPTSASASTSARACCSSPSATATRASKHEYEIKPYCEKILICGDEQVTPTHFHWEKMEDIICRGGGELLLRLWNAD
jgi:D-lyxose ketol-isomerase